VRPEPGDPRLQRQLTIARPPAPLPDLDAPCARPDILSGSPALVPTLKIPRSATRSGAAPAMLRELCAAAAVRLGSPALAVGGVSGLGSEVCGRFSGKSTGAKKLFGAAAWRGVPTGAGIWVEAACRVAGAAVVRLGSPVPGVGGVSISGSDGCGRFSGKFAGGKKLFDAAAWRGVPTGAGVVRLGSLVLGVGGASISGSIGCGRNWGLAAATKKLALMLDWMGD
jgi:hypothetical protein